MRKFTLAAAAAAIAASMLAGCGNVSITVKTPGSAETVRTEDTGDESLTVSNGLFSITLPEKARGIFEAETYANSISIYDKESKASGFGGFAFDVSAYREPSEYAGGLDVKVGEFTSSDGTLYDIAVCYPSDVQYDYTVYQDEMPENFALLYYGAEDIIKTLAAADGKGEFVWGAGTKGEDLYGEVLERHIQAINEGWDANRLEDEDMSSMYYAMSVSDEGDVLGRTGYAYYDVNNDGIDELLIGEIAEDSWKGTIYDIYTMVDRKCAHVVSGWDRNRYYVLEYGMLMNEYSEGADLSGWNVYDIVPNTTELLGQVFFKYDGYENEEQPWFISYDEGKTWDNVDEEEFRDRFIDNYIRFDFIPLSEAAGENTESEADYLGIIPGREQTTSSEGCDTFTQMVGDTLAAGQGYTNITLGDTDVLCVAGSTFSGYGDDAAIDAEIFCYSDDGAITYLGFVQCGGTATPLAVKDGMIYTAGHHYVGKHTVTDGKLVTVEEAWETFDSDGSSTFCYSSDDGGEYGDMDSDQAEEIFDELFDEYNDADMLVFDTIR